MAEGAEIKKVLPHDKQAEQTVIGSLFLDPSLIIKASGRITEADFYEKKYGALFQAMVALDTEGKPVVPQTVKERLRLIKGASALVSAEDLAEVMRAVNTSVDFDESLRIVYEKSMLRKLIQTTNSIANSCYMDEKSLPEILSTTEKQIYSLLLNKDEEEVYTIRDIMIKVVEQIESASKTGGKVTGISTGFTDLDYKTAGLQKADLVLVAARPSMGKTAFALNIAEYVAVKQNLPTVIFSLEMGSIALGKRILSMHSRVDATKLRTGSLSDSEWKLLIESMRMIGNSNLIIDGKPGMTVSEVRSRCRKYKAENDIGLVMIDYLQLLTTGKRAESRQLEIAEISRTLKAIAREIDVPVIALSQLSRDVEKRDDKRPMLSDLRDSGAIEQDADVVMFLYRDEYYHKDSTEAGITEVIIGKQRNGPVGTIKLGWQANLTKFVNIAK